MSADCVDELNELLADVISFYFKAHSAHWNVMGPDFAEYHSLFESIYSDVYESVDPIAENVRKLAMGGIKLSTARNIAISIRKDRAKQAELLSRRSELDQYTVESQADNARFDYLASVCIVDEEGKKIFSSLDEYKNKSTEPYVFEAASTLFELISETDKDWEKKLPENKFLLEHNFVNEELRFINKDKKLVDQDGRLINDKGRFINEAGEYVDRSGNRINEDGSPYIESPQPFLED